MSNAVLAPSAARIFSSKLPKKAQASVLILATWAVGVLAFIGVRGQVAALGVAVTLVVASYLKRSAADSADGIRFGAVAAVLALVLAALTFDLRGTLAASGPARYLVVTAAFAVLAAGAVGQRKILRFPLTASGVAALTLCIWGSTGSILARTVFGARTSALALCTAAGLAVLLPIVGPSIDARRCRVLLVILALACSTYTFLAALSAHGLVPGVTNLALFSHEESYLLVLAAAAAVALRWSVLLAALLASDVVIFLHYPAATYLLAVAAAALTVVAMRVRVGRRFALALCLFGLSLLVAAIALRQDILARYFSAVNKGNNTGFREVLWATTVQHWRPHPVLGSSFVGEGDLTFHVNGQYITDPSHSDYLQFLALGGLLALGLFVVWAATVMVRAISVCRTARVNEPAQLVTVLALGFATMLVTSAVNPVSARPTGATALFVVGGLLDATARQLRCR